MLSQLQCLLLSTFQPCTHKVSRNIPSQGTVFACVKIVKPFGQARRAGFITLHFREVSDWWEQLRSISGVCQRLGNHGISKPLHHYHWMASELSAGSQFWGMLICTYSALRCPDDLDKGSAELLKRTVGGIEKTTVQTQMQTHILGPRVILVSCALCFWCSLWWKHAGPKCLGFVWQKTSAAAALVSYSWLAFFKLISLVAISRTSCASFNEISQPTCWYHMTTSMINLQPEEVVYLSSNWKGSPMNVPLRPFCLKLAGGVAERHTKDHTRFPHPQAALEHFNDIAWYRNAFHCHTDLGVGNPCKVT